MARANRRTPSPSKSPQPNDVELACLALREIKRQRKKHCAWDISDPTTQVSFDVLWKEFLRAGRQRGTYAVRNRSGDPVEVAYCAEAHVLPGVMSPGCGSDPVA